MGEEDDGMTGGRQPDQISFRFIAATACAAARAVNAM
jgi:hypothetical protein